MSSERKNVKGQIQMLMFEILNSGRETYTDSFSRINTKEKKADRLTNGRHKASTVTRSTHSRNCGQEQLVLSQTVFDSIMQLRNRLKDFIKHSSADGYHKIKREGALVSRHT